MEKFPATIELAVTALLLAVVVGIPLGYLAARHQGRSWTRVVVSGSLLGVVTPVFFLAILLKLVFADWLGWLPTALRQDPRIDATHITNFYVLDGILTQEWDAAWDAILHLDPARDRAGHDPAGDHRAHHPGLGRRGAQRGLRAHRRVQGPGAAHDLAAATSCATRCCRSSPPSGSRPACCSRAPC